MDDDELYQILLEPSIQQVKSIRIKKNKPYIPKSISESGNIDSDYSVENQEGKQQLFYQSYSMLTTKNSIQMKGKTIILKSQHSTKTIKAKLATLRKVKSFRFDDSHSDDEEESLPKDLMNVNFQFRQDAIVCVQKILQQKR